MPSSVTVIEEGVFDGCMLLNKIKLSEKTTSIGEFAFNRCLALTDINIPAGAGIGECAFRNCVSLQVMEGPKTFKESNQQRRDDMKNQVINIRKKNGEVVKAEVLVIVEIDGKDYCVYSIPNGDGTADIMASYVVKDEKGYDDLKDITDKNDLEAVEYFIKNTLNDIKF